MKSVTLAEARQSFSALIAEVETFHEHVLITKNGRPTAVIISADEWEAIEDTAFWRSVPNIADLLANDPKADPPGKYKALSGVLDWATNVGYPGYATAATDEVFNTFVIPTMFARVARDEVTAQAAAEAAQKDVERIFAKWK